MCKHFGPATSWSWRDGGANGSLTHSLSHSLTLSLQIMKEQKQKQIHVSDTSRDGSSLEFIAATFGGECYIQDARGRGLHPLIIFLWEIL